MIIKGYIEPTVLEKLVYDKLQNSGITKYDYPINPFEIIKKEGIILQESSFDDNNIKGMLVHGPNATGILINGDRSKTSKRFIASHELFHHWFHPHETQTVCFEKYTKQARSLEWQANNGAAYMLMPTEVMKELYAYCRGDIDYMNEYLEVSKDCLSYRIKELKLEPPKKIYSYNSNSFTIEYYSSSNEYLNIYRWA